MLTVEALEEDLRWSKQQYDEWLAKRDGKNSGPASVLECSLGNGSLAARQDEVKDSGRFLVRVTSRRRRLIDEDNLCEKFHVDCCRYAGLIPGDSPECAHIEVRQEKVSKGEPEETLIEIYQLP